MKQKSKATAAPRQRCTFGDNLPIRDATPADGNLAVVVQACDWRRGIKGDPRRCAYARAIQRALGLPPPEKQDMGLAVYRTVVYVPVPNPAAPHGWEVLRYFVRDRAHQRWDREEKVQPQVATLVPPTMNRRLDSKKQYRKPAGAPKRRPHKKTGYKACGVRGGLYHHHQTQILGAISAVVMACTLAAAGVHADDGRHRRDERSQPLHNYIIERQQAYQVQGVPTQRLIIGRREIDIYRNGVMFERNNVVGVRGQ